MLGSIRVSHPTTFSTRESQRHLRNRFFHGLIDRLRNSLRHKYETDCSYEELLQYARMVESEKSKSGVSESTPAKATKAKASSAQQQQQPSQTKGAHKIKIKIYLLKIQANITTKIKVTTQEV